MSLTWAQYRNHRRRSGTATAALALLTVSALLLTGWFFLRGQFELSGAGNGPSTARVYDLGWMKAVEAPRTVPESSAASLLDELPVAAKGPTSQYRRTEFGQAWADEDRNGCDTRIICTLGPGGA